LFSVNIPLFILARFVGDKAVENLAATSIADYLVGIFIVMAYMYFGFKILKNWKRDKNKEISIRHHQQEIFEKDINFFTVIGDLKAVFQKDKDLTIYDPYDPDRFENFIFEGEKDEKPWHIQTAELLKLISNQYYIDKEKDWYSEESCFISKYGHNFLIGIYCTHNDPDDNIVNRFIDFVKKHAGDSQILKLVVAVKNSRTEMSTRTIKDITVEFRNENEILDRLIDLTDYRAFINKQYKENEIQQGYGVTIRDIYTEPSGTIKRYNNSGDVDENDIEDIETYVARWIEEKKERKHLALLGEYGQGKSVLSIRIAYKMLNSTRKTRIPILIELRGKFLKQADQLSLLSDFAKNHHINPNALLKLHYAGRLLMIFEGFDEMEMVKDNETLYNHFKSIWSFDNPNAKIILTGRPNFFGNMKEQHAYLRSKKQLQSISFTEEIYLNKFDNEKINKALRHADKEIMEDIMDIIENSPGNSSFIDLMSRPSLLFLASIVWKERNLSAYKDRINSAFVIKEFLEHSYIRQQQKELKLPLTIKERAYFMWGIAVGMVKLSKYSNQIKIVELKELITKLYNHFPDAISDLGTLNTDMKFPVKERFDKSRAIDTFTQDICSCGILVRDLSTSDSFKFAHKSFLEILVSDFIALRYLKKSTDEHLLIMHNAIKKALNPSFLISERSSEVTDFLAELIANGLDFDNSSSEKQKAAGVFRRLVKGLVFLNPIKVNHYLYKLGGNRKKTLLLLLFPLFSFFLLALIRTFGIRILNTTPNSTISLYTLLFLNLILFFLFIIVSRMVCVEIQKGRGVDPYNLMLWFKVCKELKISESTLLEFMPKEMYDLYSGKNKEKEG